MNRTERTWDRLSLHSCPCSTPQPLTMSSSNAGWKCRDCGVPNKSNATDGVRASDSSDDSSTESTAASSSLSSTENYNDRKRIRSNDDPRSSRQALLPLTPSSVNQQNNGDNVSSSVIDCGATDICTQQQSSQSSPHHDAITTIQLFTIKSGSKTFGDESYDIDYYSGTTVKQVVQLISNALPFKVNWRQHRLLSSSNSAYLNDHIHGDKTLKSMTGGQNPRLYLWILEPWEQLRWTTCGGLEGVREQNGLPTERWKEPVTQAKPITKNIRGRGDNSRVSLADAMSIVWDFNQKYSIVPCLLGIVS